MLLNLIPVGAAIIWLRTLTGVSPGWGCVKSASDLGYSEVETQFPWIYTAKVLAPLRTAFDSVLP